ncbi:MAG: alpha/beta hydrolase [Proteobacteria bacterium]|nr:alpha/beta hydrolase [Pseudomonadota bacterium]
MSRENNVADYKDPQIAAVRQLLAAMATPLDAPELSFAERRPGMDAFGAASPLPDGCKVETLTLGGVPAEKLTPKGADAGRILFYVHGGGYCLGSPTSHRALVARIAEAAGAVAYVVDYRLAPEHPFPAAVDDAVAAYRAVLNDGAQPGRIVIGGDSAGGGLTFATALALRAAGLPAPGGLYAISPWADLTQSGGAYVAKAAGDPMLDKAGLDNFAAGYLNGQDARAPLASPVFGDLSGLPPVLIQVGGEEVLLTDSTTLAEKIALGGGDVTLRVWPEMIHVWHFFAAQLDAGMRASQEAGAWIKARTA